MLNFESAILQAVNYYCIIAIRQYRYYKSFLIEEFGDLYALFA
jgi:hypothetical protein